MKPTPRLFSPRELAELLRLWPSPASDKQLCEWFGRDRVTLARVAHRRLGLLSSRVAARSAAFEATRESYREPQLP